MIFQIDGNLGEARAVAECLLQYVDDRLYLLPALPEKWKSGRVSNMKIPGGHTISFFFKDGKVTEVEVVLGFENKLQIDNSRGYLGEGSEILVKGEPGTRVKIK